jgi:hypothetical protein
MMTNPAILKYSQIQLSLSGQSEAGDGEETGQEIQPATVQVIRKYSLTQFR